MRYLALIFILLFSCSPSSPVSPPHHKQEFKTPSIFKNCKYIGTVTKSTIVSVAFFNNCGKEKLSLFGIIVYDSKNMRLAGFEAQEIIKKQLGYNPTLGQLTQIVISDDKGIAYPFMIFVDMTLNKKQIKEIQ